MTPQLGLLAAEAEGFVFDPRRALWAGPITLTCSLVLVFINSPRMVRMQTRMAMRAWMLTPIRRAAALHWVCILRESQRHT